MNKVFRLKSRILLLIFLAAVFVFSSGSDAQRPQNRFLDRSIKTDVEEPPLKPVDEAEELRNAFNSTEVASILVELDGEPVVVHQKNASSVPSSEVTDQRVELSSPQAQAYESQLAAEQSNFKSLAQKLSPNSRVIAELRTLVNVVALEGPGTELAAIASLPGVKRVVLSKQYKATLNTSVPLVNAPAAWARVGGSGSAGQGIKIAVLDTGINISNPLFADAGFTAPAGFPRGNTSFTNNKVIVAKVYLPNGSATPADENGHGTNVAGIAAGDFNTTSPLAQLSGVAPRAFLGNYRVLDSFGDGSDSFIIQALQDAFADGFDVANMSLGGSAGSTLGLLDQAVENAVAGGMTVVVAAGNTGDTAGTIESPAVAPSAIAVGSSTNSHVVGPGARLTVAGTVPPELSNIGATVGQGGTASSALTTPIGPAAYVDVSTFDNNNRGCSGLPAGSLTGKVALIERGNCGFSSKVVAAGSAGAVAAIIYNKSTSEGSDGGDAILIMDVSGPPAGAIPSTFITRSSGLAVRDWLNTHAGAQISLNPVPLIDLPNPPDVISTFSSRGPTTLRTLKPDLVAPGEQIYSGAITTANPAGISDPSGFAAAVGTSQASPHVAGGAALLKQLHPTWTPQQIKSALTNSANNSVFTDSTNTTRAGVLADGAGRLELDKASSVAATFSPSSLSYGFVTQANQIGKDVQITNVGSGANTFSITVQDLEPGTGVSITPSLNQVSPSPGQSTTVTMTLTATGAAAVGDHTGYVVITDQSSQVLRIPYWVSIQQAPTIQFNGNTFSAMEGPPPNGSTARVVQIFVTRQGDLSGTATVDFATSDGTASQRTRYITALGTLTFTAGQTVKSFNVILIDDGYVQDTQTVNLTLSNAVGANLAAPTQATLRIDDDEEADASTNPLDDPAYFVRQHYFDFLNRTPDTSGFNFWIGQITGPPACGTPQCLTQRRITVSNAFFFELEFQQTGAYVFRLYRAAFGNNQPFPNPRTDPNFPNEEKKLPSYQVFSRDRAKVIGGSNLAQKQLDLANVFVARPEFLNKYAASLNTAALFVDAVLANIQSDLGVNLSSQRDALITLYNSGGRGAVLYRLADDNAQNPINNRPLIDAEYNRAFVATQYFGYLRRNPDIAGIVFWLGQVNSAPLRDLGKQNAMVCSFITSAEYQLRFSPVAPHSNTECPQ